MVDQNMKPPFPYNCVAMEFIAPSTPPCAPVFTAFLAISSPAPLIALTIVPAPDNLRSFALQVLLQLHYFPEARQI